MRSSPLGRRFAVVAAFASLLLVPTPAHAQFGSLKKKLAGKKDPPAAAAASSRQRPAITPELVQTYLKGLQARDAAMRKLAQENTARGHYYAAYLRHQDAVQRQNDFNARVGPDWQRYNALNDRWRQHQDIEARKQANTILESINPENAPEPGLEGFSWQDQRDATTQLDDAARQGAGLDAGTWSQLSDLFPYVVGRVAQSDSVSPSDLGDDWSRSETNTLLQYREQLARGLGISYKTNAQIAQEKADKAAADKNEQMANDQNSCMEREMPAAERDKAQAQMQAAQKSGDMNKMMAIGQEYSQKVQAATAKCQQQH